MKKTSNVKQAADINASNILGLPQENQGLSKILLQKNLPNLFDWYLGISSIIVGFCMFLFTPFNNSLFAVKAVYFVTFLKIIFILGGFGLAVSDFIYKYTSKWRIVFSLILSLGFALTGFGYLNVNDVGGAYLFGSLSFVIMLSLIFKFHSITSFSLYFLLIVVFGPLLAFKIWPLVRIVPDGLASFVENNWSFYPIWIVFSGTILGLLFFGYFRKTRLLWTGSFIIGMGFIVFAIWLGWQLLWIKSFFLLITGYTGLFIPVYYTWKIADFELRKNIYKLFTFFILLLLLTVGVFKVFEIKFLSESKKHLSDKLFYGKIYIDSSVTQIKTQIEFFAKDKTVIALLKGDKEASASFSLRSLFISDGAIKRVGLISGKGVILNTYPYDDSLQNTDVSQRSYVLDALKTKKTVFSNQLVSKSKNRDYIEVMATPIFDNGVVLGVVAASIDFNKIARSLQYLTDTDNFEYFEAVDAENNIIMHPDTNKIGKKIDADEPLSKQTNFGIVEEGYNLDRRIDQGYSRIKNTPWLLGLEAPQINILNNYRDIFSIIYIATSMISVLLVYLTYIVNSLYSKSKE